jgi:hypothetical protein
MPFHFRPSLARRQLKTEARARQNGLESVSPKRRIFVWHRTRNSYYASASFGDSLEVFARSKHKIKRGKGFSSVCDSHEPAKLRDLAFDMETEARRIKEFLGWLREDGIIPPEPPESPFL